MNKNNQNANQWKKLSLVMSASMQYLSGSLAELYGCNANLILNRKKIWPKVL